MNTHLTIAWLLKHKWSFATVRGEWKYSTTGHNLIMSLGWDLMPLCVRRIRICYCCVPAIYPHGDSKKTFTGSVLIIFVLILSSPFPHPRSDWDVASATEGAAEYVHLHVFEFCLFSSGFYFIYSITHRSIPS